jgi:hypothetical protein
MIKASQINNLLEKWMTSPFNKKKFEVLENPKTWREAAGIFRYELRLLKHLSHSQVLRFILDLKTGEIKVWVAFLALHSDVEPDRGNQLLGSVDLSDRTAHIFNTRRSRVFASDISGQRERLEEFLDGLSVHLPED